MIIATSLNNLVTWWIFNLICSNDDLTPILFILIIIQVQNQSLMGWSHYVTKGSLSLSQKICCSGRVGIINFDTHWLSLLEEILRDDFAVPVWIEGVILLFGWSDKLQVSREMGLKEDFEDGIGLGKDIWIFQSSSIETQLDFKRIGICLW